MRVNMAHFMIRHSSKAYDLTATTYIHTHTNLIRFLWHKFNATQTAHTSWCNVIYVYTYMYTVLPTSYQITLHFLGVQSLSKSLTFTSH